MCPPGCPAAQGRFAHTFVSDGDEAKQGCLNAWEDVEFKEQLFFLAERFRAWDPRLESRQVTGMFCWALWLVTGVYPGRNQICRGGCRAVVQGPSCTHLMELPLEVPPLGCL